MLPARVHECVRMLMCQLHGLLRSLLHQHPPHRVGSGTGPAMVAPVLLAASRIFSTESCSRSTQ